MRRHWKELLYLLPAVFLCLTAAAGLAWNIPKIEDVTLAVAEKDESGEETEQTQVQETKEKKEKKSSENLSYKKTSWKDGSYTGAGTGFGGAIQVCVTIADGRMKTIEILSHSGETPSYFAKAKAVVSRMLKKQTPNVDTVSGATYSSHGICEAVANALKKAGGKESVSTTAVTAKTSGNSTDSSESSEKKTLTGKPADGVYSGSAWCDKFDYRIHLKVKFRKGKAAAIFGLSVTDNEDEANVAYYQKAWKPMVKRLLKAQNGEADAVSGATYSSNAMAEAYRDAYRKAVGKNSGKKEKKPQTTQKPKTVISEKEEPESAGTAADGTYSVSAVCEPDADQDFTAYTLSAEVTFLGGVCTSMANFSSTDESNRSYYLKAADGTAKMTGVVTQILTSQTSNGIVAVSGATCSSRTIRQLYRLALAQATGTTQTEPEDEIQTEPAPAQTPVPTQTPAASDETEEKEIKDGVYSVSAWVTDVYGDFDNYLLSGDVTFQNGKFTGLDNIKADTDTTNQSYCTRAADGTASKPGIIVQLLEKQNSQSVDAVTNATCSSLALLELYESALQQAKE